MDESPYMRRRLRRREWLRQELSKLHDEDVFRLRLLNERYVDGLRVIVSAKSIDEWNTAVELGFKIAYVPSKPNPRLRCSLWVTQDHNTGEFSVVDRPWSPTGKTCWRIEARTIPPTPIFCAYVIPKDIQVGETVFIEELIEELVHYVTPEGCQKRLLSCKATWTGERFHVSHIEPPDRPVLIG